MAADSGSNSTGIEFLLSKDSWLHAEETKDKSDGELTGLYDHRTSKIELYADKIALCAFHNMYNIVRNRKELGISDVDSQLTVAQEKKVAEKMTEWYVIKEMDVALLHELSHKYDGLLHPDMIGPGIELLKSGKSEEEAKSVLTSCGIKTYTQKELYLTLLTLV